MSQENVATITRLYDELGRPERVSDPGLLQFFDPAFVDGDVIPTALPFGLTGCGSPIPGATRSSPRTAAA